jgi:hypothetical protein
VLAPAPVLYPASLPRSPPPSAAAGRHASPNGCRALPWPTGCLTAAAPHHPTTYHHRLSTSRPLPLPLLRPEALENPGSPSFPNSGEMRWRRRTWIAGLPSSGSDAASTVRCIALVRATPNISGFLPPKDLNSREFSFPLASYS